MLSCLARPLRMLARATLSQGESLLKTDRSQAYQRRVKRQQTKQCTVHESLGCTGQTNGAMPCKSVNVHPGRCMLLPLLPARLLRQHTACLPDPRVAAATSF